MWGLCSPSGSQQSLCILSCGDSPSAQYSDSDLTLVTKYLPHRNLRPVLTCILVNLVKERWQLRMVCTRGTDASLIYRMLVCQSPYRLEPNHLPITCHSSLPMPHPQGEAGTWNNLYSWTTGQGWQSLPNSKLTICSYWRSEHVILSHLHRATCVYGKSPWYLCPQRVGVQWSRTPLKLRGCPLWPEEAWWTVILLPPEPGESLAFLGMVTRTLDTHWLRPYKTSDCSEITLQ